MIIWSRPNLRSTSSVVLVALAVSDTLVILTNLWFELPLDYNVLKAYNGLSILDHFNVVFFHNYYVQLSFNVVRVIYKMAATSSLYLTVIITLERYICICHPFWFEEWCSYSRICKSVAATIVFSFAYHVTAFWEFGVIQQTYIHEGNPTTLHIPVLSEIATDSYYAIYTWIFILVDYLIPLTSIVVLNAITFIKLRRMNRNRREISDEPKPQVPEVLIRS
ncbi:hypothetical protein GE061_003183 [Apolygus lucorum]|uniref:G-protein coupled receptors family 1 profile domain-containing protein n=1 Tax=Apolygus lucorum TaxID=248454 RepID=A0A8S9X0S8_APOLU|nr:hypothetical protein GE061_003183 [Apolygus lucorum]